MAQGGRGNPGSRETEMVAQYPQASVLHIRQAIATRKPMVECGVRVRMRDRRHQDVQGTHAASASIAS
jgi:hypothetical protein